MPQPLYRLVYVSTAREDLSQSDMVNILNVAQSNNDERYITGYLVHNANSFMQLLEGPIDEVTEIYGRILTDNRHVGVLQLMGTEIKRRAFPAWSMNYYRVDDMAHSGAMIARRDDPVDSLMTAEAPRELIYLFSNFIQQIRVN